MTEHRCTSPQGGLVKIPQPADRETRFRAPSARLSIRQKEEAK